MRRLLGHPSIETHDIKKQHLGLAAKLNAGYQTAWMAPRRLQLVVGAGFI